MVMQKHAHWGLLKRVLAENGVRINTPLFHSTSGHIAQQILTEGFKARAGGSISDVYHDNAVCFTRNLDFAKSSMFGNSQVTFILDRNDLAHRFHLYGYDWYAINSLWQNIFSILDAQVMRHDFDGTLQAEFNRLTRRSTPATGSLKKFLDFMDDHMDFLYSDDEDNPEAGDIMLNWEEDKNTILSDITQLTKLPDLEEGTFEYEERVSRTPGQFKPPPVEVHTPPGEHEDTFCLMETRIHPKYIKAILVKHGGKALEDDPEAGEEFALDTDKPLIFYWGNRYLPGHF